jgi:hypothetical protein
MAFRLLADTLPHNRTPRFTELTSTPPIPIDGHVVDTVPFLAVAGIASAAPQVRNLSLRGA